MDQFNEMLLAAIVLIVVCVVSAVQKQRKAGGKSYPHTRTQTEPDRTLKKAETASASMSFQPMERKPLEPRVHAHLEPDCGIHDEPGSLGEGSLEGKDPCHEEQMSSMERTVSRPAPEAPQLTLDWSGENMVKAFVMQEVLKRPCERRSSAR